MKIKITIEKEFDVLFLQVNAKVRYWEDSTVNGKDDTEGTLIPLRHGDAWCPRIEVESGKIIDWPEGVTANIHYKVCDQCECGLIDNDYVIIYNYEGYVPSILCPKENGYGDYIIMDINGDGIIDKWDWELLSDIIK